MARDVLVVSLGRVVADNVRVDPAEAYAVLQHAWQRIRASRDDDGAVVGVPSLDTMGLTAFGDFHVRTSPESTARSVRRPHQLAHDLGTLLLRLLGSGRLDLEGVPAACLDAARRATSARATAGGVRPIVTPEALMRALEAFRPRDPSSVLAALFARWMRTTDRSHVGTWEAVVAGNAIVAAAQAATPTTPAPAAAPSSPRRAAEPSRARPALALTLADAARGVADTRIRPAPVAAPRPVPAPRPAPAAAPRAVPAPTPVAPPAVRSRRPGGALPLMVGLVVVAALLVWSWASRRDGTVAIGPQPSTVAAPLPAQPPAPAAAPAAAHAAATGSTSLPRPAPVAVASRTRRVLRGGASGRAPSSPSFDPRTNALVFHAGADRTALLQASLRTDGSVGEVSTVRRDGSRSYHAQVSPDGRQLAYDSDAEGTRGVYVASRDGSSPRRVSGSGYASVPSWSPDGAYLAFARAEPGRRHTWNVWTVHVPTGVLRRITSHRTGQPWGASWFPDGRRIAYSLEDQLVVRDLESGVSRTYETPVRGRLVRTPAVSPDGGRIVFQVQRDGAWVLDLQTGTSERLLADASAQEFAWSPDGRRLAYQSIRGGEWGIWLLELAS